ncbi:unnamed protein product [Rotaria sp. Silwood2]|nr:unnamed protein product [Rotaria sp. Silwood2]
MQNSIDEILSLISQATSPQLHMRVAELLHTLVNTSYKEFLRNNDKREYIEIFQSHTKKLLDISLEFLSSDMAYIQYLSLITINYLYDLYVYHNLLNPGIYNTCYIPSSRQQLNHNLIKNKTQHSTTKHQNNISKRSSTLSNILRRISRENDHKRSSVNLKNSTQQVSPSVRYCTNRSSSSSIITATAKESISDLTNSNISKSNLFKYELNEKSSNQISNSINTYEPFSVLYKIEPSYLLDIMRQHLDVHRNEFNNRVKCVPSTRSPSCQHHCIVILGARLLTILSQDHNFQLKFIENKQNLSIIIDMLNINNDPVNIYTIYI